MRRCERDIEKRKSLKISPNHAIIQFMIDIVFVFISGRSNQGFVPVSSLERHTDFNGELVGVSFSRSIERHATSDPVELLIHKQIFREVRFCVFTFYLQVQTYCFL